MCERWKAIPGYEGYYEASTEGRIRSVDRIVPHSNGSLHLTGKILAQHLTANRRAAPTIYSYVNLCINGRMSRKRVCRLVAITWLGPVPDGCEVRHGPNGSEDNSVDNLCYGSKEDNANDKVRDGTVYLRRVRRSDGIEFNSIKEAEDYTDSKGWRACNIGKVCRGKLKSSGGYGWSYC